MVQAASFSSVCSLTGLAAAPTSAASAPPAPGSAPWDALKEPKAVAVPRASATLGAGAVGLGVGAWGLDGWRVLGLRVWEFEGFGFGCFLLSPATSEKTFSGLVENPFAGKK